MNDLEKWHQDGERCGWIMPRAPLWKRLPVIRQVRSALAQYQIECWYTYGPGSMGVRTGYDNWVAYGIWHGKERP